MLYLIYILDFLDIPNTDFNFFEITDEDFLRNQRNRETGKS